MLVLLPLDYLSPNETKRTVGLAADIVYVFVPSKVTGNVDISHCGVWTPRYLT